MSNNHINKDALIKYKLQKDRLFRRFDEGILLDDESWYSVTPELIAKHIAKRTLENRIMLLLDGFCGAGGNTIQFADYIRENPKKTAPFVFAIDKCESRVYMASHNSKIYNVNRYIEFIIGDYFSIAKHFRIDCAFLSPPWGGPSYSNREIFNLEELQPRSGKELYQYTKENLTKNIILQLPKNTNQKQLVELADYNGQVEIEYNYINDTIKTMTCYYGNVIDNNAFKKEVYNEEDIKP